MAQRRVMSCTCVSYFWSTVSSADFQSHAECAAPCLCGIALGDATLQVQSEPSRFVSSVNLQPVDFKCTKMAQNSQAAEHTDDWSYPFDDDEDKERKDLFRAAVESSDVLEIEKAAQALDKLATEAGPPWYAEGFVTAGLRQIIVQVGSVIPYNSQAQDKLITLLWTLGRLPERTELQSCPEWVKLFDEDFRMEVTGALRGKCSTWIIFSTTACSQHETQ